MVLKETATGVEMDRAGRMVDRTIPDIVQRLMRGEAVRCAGCQQSIRGSEVSTILGRPHHPACAGRALRQASTPDARRPAIALLRGRAVPFGERCTIFAA